MSCQAIRAFALAGAILLAIAGNGEARELRYSLREDAASLDPHFASGEAARVLRHQMYQGLTRLDASHRPAPLLAHGWSSEDGGRVWHFYLREDIRFHDGRDLRADDVVFSIRRATRNPSRQMSDLRHIATVSSEGERKVRIETRRPDALLPARLATVMIMSRDWVVEQSRAYGRVSPDSWDPIEPATWHAISVSNGTGPYKLVRRVTGEVTELVANPDYWNRARLPEQPFRRLTFRPIEDDKQRVAALATGDLDIVLDPPIAALDALSGKSPAVRLTAVAQPASLLIGFDTASRDQAWDDVSGANPFGDERVRRAIALAVDAEAMRNVIHHGRSLPSGMPVPPVVAGWSEEQDRRLPVDVKKARALLAEAGYEDGFSVTLHCPSGGYPRVGATCRAMAAMLGLAGIEARMRTRPLPRHMAALREGLSAFYLLPWRATTYDSRQTLEDLYHTPNGDFGDANYARVSDDELDEKIAGLAGAIHRHDAEGLYADAWDRALEPGTYVTLDHRVDTWLARRAFMIEPDGFGLPDFAHAGFVAPSAGLDPDRPPPTGP